MKQIYGRFSFLVMLAFSFGAQAATTMVGSTPGSFAVSPSGAATYTISIQVPPGINELEPHLSLTYNSQGNNGALGVGWELSGLSAITRCQASYDQDGYKGGVKVDASDRYCLDGQRLVVVTGNYGGTDAEYRTEIDGGARIFANMYGSGDPASFQTRDKRGSINRYGYSIDGLWQGSRIEHGSSVMVREWLLAETQNTLGNKVFYRYYEDNINGYHRIESIEYNNGEARIEFKYETRPDVITRGIAGVMTSIPERLSNVQTFSGGRLIRDYRLAYEESVATRRSWLGKVTECFFGGQCRAPVVFKNTDSSSDFKAGFNSQTWTVPNAWGQSGYTWVGDFDGDGLSDVASADYGNVHVRLARSNGFENQTWTVPNAWGQSKYTWVGDFDGDGLSDIASADSGNVYVHRSTGNGFTSQIWTVPNAWGGSEYTWVGDFNGDGLTDIASAYYGNVYVHLSTGKGFSSQTWTVPNAWGGIEYTWVGDFNGDGLSDIASAYYGNVYVHLSKGNGFTSQTWTVPNVWGGPEYTRVGDFNGDGLSDIASAYYGNVYVHLSMGKGFASRTWTVPNAWGGPGYTWVGDFNGDGVSDIASANSGNIYVHLTNTPRTDGVSGIGSSMSYVIDYERSNTNSAHTYPFSGTQPTLYVVSAVEADDGVGGKLRTTYHYEGAKLHLRGRGFLGFKSTVFSNAVDGSTIETTYIQMSQTRDSHLLPFANRDFWKNGLVESQRTLINNIAVSTTTNTWAQRVSDAGQVIPYLASSTSVTREPTTGQVISTSIQTTDGIDQYGNVTQSTQKVFAGAYDVGANYVTVTKTDYWLPSNYSIWLPGQIRSQTIDRSMPYDDGNALVSANRTASSYAEYDYYPATGQLWHEKTEPNSTSLWSTKTYEYDPTYGYQSKVTVTGAGLDQPRWSQTAINYYYAYDQYEVTTTNALNHVEKSYYSFATGAVIGNRGPNGIVGTNGLGTQWFYDDFGRKIKELRADGNTSTWEYLDCVGDYKCVTGETYYIRSAQSGGPWSEAYYDMLGREVRSVTPAFNYSANLLVVTKRQQYDHLGRVVGVTNKYLPYSTVYWSCTQYDAMGRVVRQKAPSTLTCDMANGVDLETFDYNGLATTQTKYNVGTTGPQTTTQRKNVVGQLAEVQDALYNPPTKYFYNAQGKLVLVRDAVGNEIKTGYDKLGRKVSMDDPDMGHWDYGYNALGELVTQKNARLQTVTMHYDVLGRMDRRSEPDGSTTTWVYDQGYKAIGKATSVSNSASGFSRTFQFDGYGRPKTAISNILFSPYQMDTSYDQFGRISVVTYPAQGNGSRFAVQNCYDDSGFLKEVRQPGTCFTATGYYWKANGINSDGQVSNETVGNGLNTARVYDEVWGRLTSISTGVSGNTVQMSSFVYDTLGNLEQRRWMGVSGGAQNMSENFTYDALNRLKTAMVVGVATKSYGYDAIGNMLSKSDFGNVYDYGTDRIRPHAVRRVYNNGVLKASYTYDADGFTTGGYGRTITPTWFDKPYEMTKGVNFSRFGYDTDQSRVVQTTEKGFTVYLNPRIDTGGTYEKATLNGVVTHKHYLYSPAGVIGVVEAKESASTGLPQGSTTKYFHKDHLGSVEVITDQSRTVLARYSYDAFGKDRAPDTTVSRLSTDLVLTVSAHRFTSHEHMDNMGIVHMNGRTYDSELGRFMSADPSIDGASNPQGYNRYSYLQNNPLNATDPSGYKKFWNKKWFKKAVLTVGVIALAAYSGGAAYSAFMSSQAGSAMAIAGYSGSAISAAAGAVTGAASGAVMGAAYGYAATGDLNGAVKGALGGALVGGLGGAIGGYFGNNLMGRSLMGGFNGAMQTGTPQGFARGLVSGMVPTDLWMPGAFQNDAFANTMINIARDGIRGGIIDGRDGAQRGIEMGLFNNATGHMFGYAMQKGWNAPRFEHGSWRYDVTTIPFSSKTPAVTFGNVVSYNSQYPSDVLDSWRDHELGHALDQSALGGAYFPLHIISQGFGSNFLEREPYQWVRPY